MLTYFSTCDHCLIVTQHCAPNLHTLTHTLYVNLSNINLYDCIPVCVKHNIYTHHWTLIIRGHMMVYLFLSTTLNQFPKNYIIITYVVFPWRKRNKQMFYLVVIVIMFVTNLFVSLVIHVVFLGHFTKLEEKYCWWTLHTARIRNCSL